MRYKDSFKKEMVRKMLSGESGVLEISQKIGVCPNTLYNWRNKFSEFDEIKLGNHSPRKWKIMVRGKFRREIKKVLSVKSSCKTVKMRRIIDNEKKIYTRI